MLIFEYARAVEIDPKSLSNEAPRIWRWSNPDLSIADWMQTLYSLGLALDPSAVAVYSSCYVEEKLMTSVPDYATMVATTFSFYWDNTSQVAYFNFEGVNPQGFGFMKLAKVFGATDTVAMVYGGILYPNILITKPSITREVEPVAYTRLATQSFSIEMQNDALYKMVDDKPVKYWRFDDLIQYEEGIAGQTTYLRQGEPTDAYEDLKLLQKGIIIDSTVTPTKVILYCDDKRTMSDAEWPKTTFAEEGFTISNVEESMLDKKVPDGYGLNRLMAMTCINRETTILAVDDDDVLVLPTDQLLSWDINGWTKSSADVTKSAGYTIAKFPSYRVAKTAASSSLTKTFVATMLKNKISGYIRCDIADIPTANTIVSINGVGSVSINFGTKSFTSSGATQVRVKFITNDDGKIICHYSFEVSLAVGSTYSHILYVDSSAVTTSAVVVAGMRVSAPVYPMFKVAQKLSAVGLTVCYEKDDEFIDITNIVSVDADAGTVTLFDVDAHENGMLDAGLSKLYCTATLKTQGNPMDIIVDLNYDLYGIPYMPSIYNIALCEAEKLKLSNVCLYRDSATKLTALIEELQSGSVVGFRYDDIDKIYIYCDDPNRPYTFNIQSGEVLNKDDLDPSANLKLYADEVTVNYSTSRKDNEVLKYKNTDYKQAVLLRYNYTKPMTVDTLIINEADAYKKSLVLLEDLSFTRPIVRIKRYGLEILKLIDLYHIGYVDLKLAEDRPFLGRVRVQILAIEVDTQFGFVYLTLRERVYSDVFADIVGQYADAYLIGANEMVLGDNTIDKETVLGGRGL